MAGSLVPVPKPGAAASAASPATPTNPSAQPATNEPTAAQLLEEAQAMRSEVSQIIDSRKTKIMLIRIMVGLGALTILYVIITGVYSSYNKTKVQEKCLELRMTHPDARCNVEESEVSLPPAQAVARMRPPVAQIPAPAVVPPQVAQQDAPATKPPIDNDGIPTFTVTEDNTAPTFPPGGVMRLCVRVKEIPGFPRGKKFYPSETMKIEGEYTVWPKEAGSMTIFVRDGECIIATNLKTAPHGRTS